MILADLIHENVVDKSLRQWILPDFTTTTTYRERYRHVRPHDDGADFQKAGTFQKFLSSITKSTPMRIPCVTLEGEKSDWVIILSPSLQTRVFRSRTKSLGSLTSTNSQLFHQSLRRRHRY